MIPRRIVTRRTKQQIEKPYPQKTVHNNTPWTIEQVMTFERYGGFLNEWRERFVDVFQPPTDWIEANPNEPQKVVTIGSNYRTNTYWVCLEPFVGYAGRIQNGNWSTYK